MILRCAESALDLAVGSGSGPLKGLFQLGDQATGTVQVHTGTDCS